MGARRGGRDLIAVDPPAAVVPGSLGVLGGTFDPIHHGHLAIAEEVREALGLEAVLFVPARTPPHRADAPGAGPEDRARMVALAIATNPAFALSRLELDRPGPSWTADTLEAIAAARGRERAELPEPVFILSAEALAGLPTWHEPARVLALARLAVVPRAGTATPEPGWVEQHFPGAAARFLWLPGPLLPISGSVIRARAARRRSLRYLVPDAVAGYIEDHGLYRSGRRSVAGATGSPVPSAPHGRPAPAGSPLEDPAT